MGELLYITQKENIVYMFDILWEVVEYAHVKVSGILHPGIL